MMILILAAMAAAQEPAVTTDRGTQCESLIRARKRARFWAWFAGAPTSTVGSVLTATGVGETFGDDPAGPTNTALGLVIVGGGAATFVVLQLHASEMQRQADALGCGTPVR